MSGPQYDWLIVQGLLPLLGAGFICIILGCFKYISANNKPSFTYDWKQAADPISWLYGALIIAAQSAQKSFSVKEDTTLAWACVVAGSICLLLLATAMTEKASSNSWTPPKSLQIFAAILVAATLFAGFIVNTPNQDIRGSSHSEGKS